MPQGVYAAQAPQARDLDFDMTMTSLRSSYLCAATRSTLHQPCMPPPTVSATIYRPDNLPRARPQCYPTESLGRHLVTEMRHCDNPGPQPHPAQLHLSREKMTQDIQALHPQVTTARTSVRASALFYANDEPAHRARMHSLRCRHAGACLDTVPVSPYLRLSDADICGGQFRLGATGTNPNIAATSLWSPPARQRHRSCHDMQQTQRQPQPQTRPLGKRTKPSDRPRRL